MRASQVAPARCCSPAWLWGRPAALWLSQGAQGTLTQMGWFFTKAALLTFGGAYAVLPYVYQGAVEDQWLNATQMIDGLALARPRRPLIMVVPRRLRRRLGQAGAGAGGAVRRRAGGGSRHLVHLLPSFVFILPAGRWSRPHGKLGFTAPLTAITAAVVGVILNLALFFAYRAVAAGLRRAFRLAFGADRSGRGAGAVPFQGGRDALLAACAAVGLVAAGPSWRMNMSHITGRTGAVAGAGLRLRAAGRAPWRAREHGAQIAGAHWHDPAAWLDWKDSIGTRRPAVLVCAKGHEIGQGLTAALRALGVDARYLVGGMQGWLDEGRPTMPLGAPS